MHGVDRPWRTGQQVFKVFATDSNCIPDVNKPRRTCKISNCMPLTQAVFCTVYWWAVCCALTLPVCSPCFAPCLDPCPTLCLYFVIFLVLPFRCCLIFACSLSVYRIAGSLILSCIYISLCLALCIFFYLLPFLPSVFTPSFTLHFPLLVVCPSMPYCLVVWLSVPYCQLVWFSVPYRLVVWSSVPYCLILWSSVP